MYACSITGMPFQSESKVVLIPVLIRKDFTDSTSSNTNVRPFPIAVRGSFSEEVFYVDKQDKDREAFMLAMLSNVFGRTITLTDFLWMRGKEKEVEYDENDYVVGFFACHQSVYNSVMTNFRTKPHFSKTKVDFTEYCRDFVHYIHVETQPFVTLVDEHYRTKLATHRSGFIVPDNFEVEHLPYLAEVKFVNTFLSMIGKKWDVAGIHADSYAADVAFDLYKNAISSLL